jgi:transposase InsO family protein
MAIATRKTDNLIHHSDQGRKFPVKNILKYYKDNGSRISRSVKGTPYDNATALIIL